MIPNLVKGRGITGALAYAMGQGNEADGKTRKKLEAGKESRAVILGGQNFGYEVDSPERLEIARRDMEWNGKAENQASRGRKCENDCLHLSASWEKGYEPTRDEMLDAGKGLLKALGMENAQAVFIAHSDTPQRHIHVVASRIDPDTGKTFSQEEDFTKAQVWGLQYEREHGQIPENEARRNLHKIVDAIEARDGKALVDNLTARTPTFAARDLDQALKYGGLEKAEREKFRGEILADKNVIGLKDTPDAKVTRYTTRDVLASEMALLRTAQKLADDRSHGLSESRIIETAAAFTLKPEQADALAHLTSAEGFAVLWGEAGTGKSHTLKAVRSAYEAEGANVIGLGPTHKVKDAMRDGGFKEANTIAAELKGIEEGRTAWNKKTVVVVDEAAMVSTENLAQLAGAAQRAGAKFIIAGDDAQLPSIERGGMFETLRQKHGAAILREVQRTDDLEERKLWGKMHKGEFREMLAKQEKAGNIHWSGKQTDAMRDMAKAYTTDTAADPSKSRFMFAFTNAEVGALNDYAREVHKRRGDLGEDCTLKTAHGEATFATGDRIQFAGNGYGKKAINAGLSNGYVGTIKAIAFEGDFLTPRVTVALDTAKGEKPKEVSFVVGSDGKAGEFDNFKHGYAGTIYRGQGNTLDESYVCHSAQWRGSASYVALTRHREEVHIFASVETVRGMDRKADRAGFDRVGEQTTLDAEGLAAAQRTHDLDTMAKGLARPENKRAATAYHLDDSSALRIDFDDVARAATKAPLPAAEPAPASLRGYDRVQAFLEAERQQRQADASKGQANRIEAAHEPPQPVEVRSMTTRNADRVEEYLKATNLDREAKKALLQELGRDAGREVNEQEGKEITQDRGGGQSL